jgi:hypothetical protein
MAIEAAGARGSFNTDSHRPSSADNPETPLRRGFLFRPQMRFDQLPSCFVDTLHNGENESCRRSSHLGYFENEHGRNGTVLSTRKLNNKHLLGKATAR